MRIDRCILVRLRNSFRTEHRYVMLYKKELPWIHPREFSKLIKIAASHRDDQESSIPALSSSISVVETIITKEETSIVADAYFSNTPSPPQRRWNIRFLSFGN